MEAPKVYCEIFARDPNLMPSIDDMVNAADTEQRERFYREAGLEALAQSVTSLGRATAAGNSFVELPWGEYQLYVGFLPEIVELKNCTIIPPDEALPVLIATQEAELFDSIVVLTSLQAQENLMLGYVQVGSTRRYYKIAHWGHHKPTTIKQLRRRQMWQFGQHLSGWLRSQQTRNSHGPIFFAAVTVFAGAPSWLFLLPISWWLFAAVLAVSLILCGYYVAQRTPEETIQRRTVGWIIAVQAIAAVVSGAYHINQWQTADRTEEALVCGVHYSGDGDVWIAETSAGTRNLEDGFYDGTYYPIGSETAARLLPGKWVRITEHGYSSGKESGPYVTRVVILRDGPCG